MLPRVPLVHRVVDAVTPLDAALAYQQAGWSVVPAAIEGKRALISWRRWQQAVADPYQLHAWWRRWPKANPALVTGAVSGVAVVDVDPRHRGDHALAELEQRDVDLPWLAVVETPSGGVHVYLRHPGGRIANSVSRIGLGVDVRGDGGLALLPPSRRPDGCYRWAVGGPTTVPEMPDSWIQLLRPPPTQAVAGMRRPLGAAKDPPARSHHPGSRQHAVRLAGILRALQRAPEGERNNTLYWCGRRLAEMVDHGAPAHWRQVLADTARQCGLTAAEIEDTLDSAMGAER
jgi:Bifunctional DNA primase/polymerase, N-terminal